MDYKTFEIGKGSTITASDSEMSAGAENNPLIPVSSLYEYQQGTASSPYIINSSTTDGDEKSD